MTINLQKPDITELKPRITVFGVGGGGGNAVNNMISSGLDGVEFVVANTDAQALSMSQAERVIQMGVQVTEGLGAGSQPEIGAAAAEECLDEIKDHLSGTHMAFVTAGMGGGTGTGAAPVIARAAREAGILTVGVVTKPFSFEGKRRMKLAEDGIAELQANVDTLIVIPNQNLFRVANDKTTFADAFSMADQVLYSGVACITDLMTKEGLINLDFADVRSVTRNMGRAMMGTGEASGEGRARAAAEAAISNPLLDETSMSGAMGLLISITGGRDITLFEVDEAATRISEEVSEDANIIVGATHDDALEGVIRVSVVATSIDTASIQANPANEQRMKLAADRLLQSTQTGAPAKDTDELADKPKAPIIARAPTSNETAAAPVAAAVKAPFAAPAPAAPQPISDAAFQHELEEQLGRTVAPAALQPAPVQPVSMQPTAARMPRAEDFPPIAQQRMDHASSERSGHDEQGAVGGLFKRLTSGFGGYHGENSAQPAPVRQPVQPAAPAQAAPVQDRNPYAPARPTLDDHGRAVAPQQSRSLSDEEQLDIPAFLRRQAN